MKKRKKSMLSLLATLVLLGSLIAGGTASAATIYDFSDFPTIQSGSTKVGYVKAVQVNLYCYGLSSTVGSIDGSFGTGTTNAVKKFQTNKGLTSDGKVGALTWDEMSVSATVEVPGVSFYLWSGDSTTYWALYGLSGGKLLYELMYKSNNYVVNSGTVY